MTVVPIACQSEGALQVYIEPALPSPQLVVVGHSPMAATLADLSRALGWRTSVLDRGEFSAADADERSMVVVATQGHGDEDAVEQAVAARPAYLGLVASVKRAAAELGYLADRACRRTSSTGSGCPRAWTWAGRRTARSRWRSWPSWSSCARPVVLPGRASVRERLCPGGCTEGVSPPSQGLAGGSGVVLLSGRAERGSPPRDSRSIRSAG